VSSTTFDRPGTPAPLAEPADFSLVLGGPLYQLLRRVRLTDDALSMVHRRILAGVLITWLPLLLLSTLEGRAWRGSADVPFLLNFEVHARFLLALPLLILTLGLFTFVLNALTLWLTGTISDALGLGFHVAGFWAAFFGALVVSLVSLMLSFFVASGPQPARH
jgi:hypothetical protein